MHAAPSDDVAGTACPCARSTRDGNLFYCFVLMCAKWWMMSTLKGQSPSPTSNRQPMIQPPTVQVGASNIPNKKVAAATTTNNGGELIRQWDSSPVTTLPHPPTIMNVHEDLLEDAAPQTSVLSGRHSVWVYADVRSNLLDVSNYIFLGR